MSSSCPVHGPNAGCACRSSYAADDEKFREALLQIKAVRDIGADYKCRESGNWVNDAIVERDAMYALACDALNVQPGLPETHPDECECSACHGLRGRFDGQRDYIVSIPASAPSAADVVLGSLPSTHSSEGSLSATVGAVHVAPNEHVKFLRDVVAFQDAATDRQHGLSLSYERSRGLLTEIDRLQREEIRLGLRLQQEREANSKLAAVRSGDSVSAHAVDKAKSRVAPDTPVFRIQHWLERINRDRVTRAFQQFVLDADEARQILEALKERDALHRQLLEHAEVCTESAYPLSMRLVDHRS